METPSFYLNKVLAEMAAKKASSLHLTVGSLPTLRIDNHFEIMEGEDIVTKELLEKIIDSYYDDEERKKLLEGKSLIAVKNFSNNFRFKVSIFFQKKSPAITFYRIEEEIKSFDDLKLPPELHRFTDLSSGLFIIAGSYGSGKSTTAAAFIEEFNRNKNKRIVTIEDPIERLFVSKKSIIEQRQLDVDVKSIEDGLYYCLKEDIDLIYVGENREILEHGLPLIMELASGNALVILEINAQSSIGVMEKILSHLESSLSAEASRHIFADVLFSIIVQRLIPRRGGGMVMAQEITIANSPIKSLIREGKFYQIESIIQTSRKEGMAHMQKVLEELVQRGDVRQEDIL